MQLDYTDHLTPDIFQRQFFLESEGERSNFNEFVFVKVCTHTKNLQLSQQPVIGREML